MSEQSDVRRLLLLPAMPPATAMRAFRPTMALHACVCELTW